MATKQLSECGETIKQAYEGEPNTNAYTDTEKVKLSGIAAGAQVNAVTSVAGRAGAVTLSIDDIANLQNALGGKAAASHTQSAASIIDFNEAVDERIAAQKALDGALVFRGDNTGITDVTADLESFIELADTLGGGKKVYIPDGIWLVNDLDPDSSINVEASANAIFRYNQDASFINTSKQSEYVAANAVQQNVSAITRELAPDGFGATTDSDYTNVLQVVDASGFDYGDVVVVSSSNLHPGSGGRMAEATKVRWVDTVANKIYLIGVLNQAAYYTTDVTVTKYPLGRTFKWKGGKVEANGDWRSVNIDSPPGEHNHAIYIKNFPFMEVSHVELDGTWEGGIVPWNCPFASVHDIILRNGPNLRTLAETLGANPFATNTATNAGGQTTIVVTHAGHSFITGQEVTFSGATTFNGIAAATLNAKYPVTVINANAYSFLVTGSASGTGSGGGSSAKVTMMGRIGYGIQPYGHSGFFNVYNIQGEEYRHLFTTGDRTDNSFTKGEWYAYGQPTNGYVRGIVSNGAYGIPVETHEGCDNITFTDVEINFPLQGPQGGSYDAYGFQLRGSNININGYHQNGGTNGLRLFNAETLAGSVHNLENITVENLSESTNNDIAFRLETFSALTTKTKVRMGRFAVKNCGRIFRLMGGGIDFYCADFEASEIGVRAFQIHDSGAAPNTILFGRSSFDMRGDPRAQSSQHLCYLTGADTVHLGALTVIMGATTAETPRVFSTLAGTTPGKKVGYSSLTFVDPSGVGKLEAFAYDNASEYSWIGGGDVVNLPIGDNATAVAAGADVASFIMPQRFQVVDLMAQVKTASSAGDIVFDVNKNAASMMGTSKLTIDANEKSTITAATAFSYDATGSATAVASAFSMLARGDTVSVDVDSAGTGAVGGVVSLRGFWC